MDKHIDVGVIREVMRVARQMEEKNLVNTFEGNLSMKRDGLIYITPSQMSKAALTEEMIAVFDEQDRQIHGDYPASTEKSMHRGAYTVREEIKAVIHCHAPYLTAHAICHVPLDYKCHPEILFFFKDIPVAPYGQPGTQAMIDTARLYLAERNVVLLANHGVLSVGSTLDKACQRLETAEKFAHIIQICRGVGKMVDIPQSEIDRLLARPLDT